MNQRKRYSSQEKVSILREHFEQNVSVAEICEKFRIPPHQFHRWTKEFFERATGVFTTKGPDKTTEKRVHQLEHQLAERNAVIAELLQENLKLKKNPGAN
jgi:transposase-like protein